MAPPRRRVRGRPWSHRPRTNAVPIGGAERGEAHPEAGLVVAPAAAERKPRVARAQIPASRQLAQRSWWLAGRPVDRLPDAGEQAIAAQHRHGGREDRPAPANEAGVIAPQRRKAAEGLEAPGRRPRPGPPSHRQCLVSERRGDEVSDEAVYLQPVRELPVRAPVVAP